MHWHSNTLRIFLHSFSASCSSFAHRDHLNHHWSWTFYCIPTSFLTSRPLFAISPGLWECFYRFFLLFWDSVVRSGGNMLLKCYCTFHCSNYGVALIIDVSRMFSSNIRVLDYYTTLWYKNVPNIIFPFAWYVFWAVYLQAKTQPAANSPLKLWIYVYAHFTVAIRDSKRQLYQISDITVFYALIFLD